MIRPKKSLSQNFLTDKNIIKKQIEAADIQPGELVLEIGPGTGNLTYALLEKGAQVIAVEKDDHLFQALKPHPNLTVFNDDILQFPLEKHISGKIKVVANLPYQITAPILSYLVKYKTFIQSAIIMVQDEVAYRMSAEPGSKEYSSLSVFLSYHGVAKYLFKVKNRCFFPVPKVESAVVSLKFQESPSVKNEEDFFKLIRTMFQMRRKMIRRSLRANYSKESIDIALQSAEITSTARPEELSLDQLITLHSAIS